jgi:Zn-finger nucleic acid-binding protein
MSYDTGLVAIAFARAHRARVPKRRLKAIKKSKTLSPEESQMVASIQAQIAGCVRLSSTKRCPECARPFSVVKLDGVELDACWLCQGIWFDAGELRHLTGFSQDLPAVQLQSRRSRYACPVCGETMQEHVFIHSHNLLADKCPADHGVYLEKGELERAFGIS